MSEPMTHPLAALIAGVQRRSFLFNEDDQQYYMAAEPNGAYVLYAEVLAALEAAPHVNETPKSEHDSADVLTVPDLVEAGKVLEGVTKGKAVQFHPYYCEEAKNVAFANWDTSHHVSVIREDDGTRYRVGEFRHSSDAAFFQWCVNNVPALIALATAQAAQIKGLEAQAVAMRDAFLSIEHLTESDRIRGIARSARTTAILRALEEDGRDDGITNGITCPVNR